ncbi:hypothetical protein BJ944DRAFT_259712 [Cunninghamella echinulata]|nr:hypothetical protein BJ944DRAFT_259712 [Cunninghamella echinulata]
MSLNIVLDKIRTIYKVDKENADTYLLNNWFIISTIVISTLNQPQDIKYVYSFIQNDIQSFKNLSIEQKIDLEVKIVMKLRDAILKGFIATGFPKTINGLQELYKNTPEPIKEKIPKDPIRQEETWQQISDQRQRGQKLFDVIYDRHTKKVMNTMDTIYPDLGQTARYHIYGPILSDVTFLSPKETSLVVVAGCFAQNIPSQLRGHAYGALHNGATQDDLNILYDTVIALCHHYHIPLDVNIRPNTILKKSKL